MSAPRTLIALSPNLTRPSFSAGRAPSGQAKDRVIFVSRDFAVSIAHAVIAVAGFLALLGALEHGIYTRRLPQSDSMYQFSQWGTWVIAVLVAIITIVIQWASAPRGANEVDETTKIKLCGVDQEQQQRGEYVQTQQLLEDQALQFRLLRHGY